MGSGPRRQEAPRPGHSLDRLAAARPAVSGCGLRPLQALDHDPVPRPDPPRIAKTESAIIGQEMTPCRAYRLSKYTKSIRNTAPSRTLFASTLIPGGSTAAKLSVSVNPSLRSP